MSRPGQVVNLAATFDKLRADYNLTKQTRFSRRRTGLSLQGSGADYHIRSEAEYLRGIEYARDVDRNDLVGGQAVNRLVDEVFLDGFQLDPLTGQKGLDEDLWGRFDEWARDPDLCHVAGEHDLSTISRMTFRGAIVDGDSLALPLETGQLQLVENHRLRTPTGTVKNVVHGVLLDGQRRRLEYWLTKDDIDPSRPVTKVGDMHRIPARDRDGWRQVFHFYLPRRVSQTRGVTAYAPIFEALGMHDDLEFSKLVQQQVASCIAFLRERELGFDADAGKPGYGATETQTQADGSTRTIHDLAPGMEIPTLPGEKIHGFSPAIPNPGFFEQAMLILTFVAVNLGLPVQVLLLDPKNTNFSGWRGAMDQARLGFREFQRVFAARFLRHVYRWKCRQWASQDPALGTAERELGPKYYEHRWNPPRWPYIEPNKDAQADTLRLEKRLTSHRRLHAEHGNQYEHIADEWVADAGYLILAAKKKAQEINGLYPEDPVSWREILSGDMAKAAASPPAGGGPKAPEENPEGTEEENPEELEEDEEEERDAA